LPDFWYFSSALEVAILWKMTQLKLLVRLPWFGIWLTIRLIQAPALLLLRDFSGAQRQIEFLIATLLLGSLALTAAEIYAEVTREVFELGRAGTAVALLAAVLGAAVAFTTTGSMSYETEVKRAVYTFVAAALSAALWFYGRFPLPLASYVWPHAEVFLVYVASHALGYWAIAAFDPGVVQELNRFLILGWCACLTAWLWLFSKPPSYPLEASRDELEIANRRARQLERAVNQ